MDEYQTPPWCVEALLTLVHPQGTFLEPCLGEGNIMKVIGRLPAIVEADFCEIKQGRDFLTERLNHFDWIITNPPFTLAMEFLERSMSIAVNMAFLLRLNFLGSQKRRSFWQKHPPTGLYVLSRRPSFSGDGSTDSIEYAWFVWSESSPKGVRVL